jgi:cytochrome P450
MPRHRAARLPSARVASVAATRSLHASGRAAISSAGQPSAGRSVADEFSDYCITPGTRIAVAVAATHLLPDNHPDPLRFDIDRYACADSASRTRPFVLLTFAGGARMCLGMRFAQMEFKTIVARVLQTMALSAVGGDVAHAGFWNARPAGPMRALLRAR